MRRPFNAIHASCSRVVPNSWKWRIAIIAIQLAAEGAPYGRRHCMNPPTRGRPPRELPPPIPGMTAARPLSPCAVPSHTVRKHRTWLATPADTAMHAFTTDPSWPGASNPPAYQLRFRRSASCTSVTPTPEKPGGMSIAPGYVAMPSMSSRVRPACSIASRHASSVRSSGSRCRRRPTSDCPTPLMMADRFIGRARRRAATRPRTARTSLAAACRSRPRPARNRRCRS